MIKPVFFEPRYSEWLLGAERIHSTKICTSDVLATILSLCVSVRSE